MTDNFPFSKSLELSAKIVESGFMMCRIQLIKKMHLKWMLKTGMAKSWLGLKF